MVIRILVTSLFCAALSQPVSAEAPYGIETSPETLRVMMGHHSMATNLELGRQTAIDYSLAAKIYRKAAVMGYPLSQNRLGRLYELGRGVPRDDVKAYAWYTIAASHGNENAAANRDAASRRLSTAQMAEAEALVQKLKGEIP